MHSEESEHLDDVNAARPCCAALHFQHAWLQSGPKREREKCADEKERENGEITRREGKGENRMPEGRDRVAHRARDDAVGVPTQPFFTRDVTAQNLQCNVKLHFFLHCTFSFSAVHMIG